MKIRSLHPGFFSDPSLARMTAHTRLLYQGLWCIADDDGRGEWLPKAIEGSVFPHEDVDIADLLDELASDGKIERYEVDGRCYWWLPNFSKWQSPRYKRKSTIPAPPSHNSAETLREISSGLAKTGRQEGVGEGVGEVEGEEDIAPSGAALATRPANPHWDTLVDLFGPPTQPQRSLYGRVTQLAKATGPPSEIVRRAEHVAETWGTDKLTVASLEKHWNRVDSAVAQVGDVGEAKRRIERERFLSEEEVSA